MKKFYFWSTLILLIMAVILPLDLKSQMVETHVTSFGSYNFSGKKFFILSNMENVSSDDVEFKEYARLISYAFQMRGGIEVQKSEESDICILLSYDIKDASYVRTVSEPVWGKTGVRSVTATTNSLGTNYNYYYDYGVVDYKQSQQLVNKFIRYIDLFVYELSSDGKDTQKMIWKAYAKSEGNTNNLFTVFPCMALALYGDIGYTSADDLARYKTDMWCVQYFKRGVFSTKHRTYSPYIESGKKITSFALGSDEFTIWQIRREDNYTRVTFQISWPYTFDNSFKFYENTFIKYKDQEYNWTDAYYVNYENGVMEDKISMGKRNHCISNGGLTEVFVCIDFEPIPKDADVIDLISQKKNKRSKDDMVWKGIHLRNW